MSAREIQFLNESNRIEGITNINYSLKCFQDPTRGHFGAYILSQAEAREHRPITGKMIRNWQALIGKEQQTYTTDHIANEAIGHFRNLCFPTNVRIADRIPPDFSEVGILMTYFIEDLNENLTKYAELYRTDDVAYLNFVSSTFLSFERIHPFADVNGRTGRLLSNYIATYCDRPIHVFPGDYCNRNKYLRAHSSDKAMYEYFSEMFQKQLQEKTYDKIEVT